MGHLSRDLRKIALLAQVLLLTFVGIVVAGFIFLTLLLINLFSFIFNVIGHYHG